MTAIVVLGATGDLTRRYLLPALAQLLALDRIDPGLRLVGVARDEWDDEAFRRHVAEALSYRRQAPRN